MYENVCSAASLFWCSKAPMHFLLTFGKSRCGWLHVQKKGKTMPTVFVNGKQRQYEKGTTFEKIVEEFQPQFHNQIALVSFNQKVRELNKRLDRDGVISLVTTKNPTGYRAFVRTATLMLVKTVAELGGEGRLHTRMEFSLGNAYFCTIHGELTPELEAQGFTKTEDGNLLVPQAFSDKIQKEMEQLRDRKASIIKKTYPIGDAVNLFSRQGMEDKVKLFRFRRSSSVNVYNLEGYYDYYYGYMLPSTDYVRKFEVTSYRDGILLNLPGVDTPDTLSPFQDREHIYEQLMLSTDWGHLVGISNIGELNEEICRGNISDMILVQEALQERRIGDIAGQIAGDENIRVVLISGPSSSGKTTSAHRLAIQLRSFGLRPHILSMDNWFVPRECTPLDEDGNYDFECLEAVDLQLFNENVSDLLDGEEVELPTFDFKSGKRRYNGHPMSMGEEDILIIEGIHGLNPKCSEGIPDECKFKVYVSALTSLNIDEHNRISSSDTRLLRRIVRDSRTRGNSAQDTIAMWKKVREGEEKYIFPYQNNADAIFNSVLIYEQAVLKQFAEPQLFAVPSDAPEYGDAKRLLKFLEYFVGVDTTALPANSICREFVGGGCFPV